MRRSPPHRGICPSSGCRSAAWARSAAMNRAGHRSSCGLGGALLVQEALEGGVLGGVVGGAVLPAAPDEVEPGAGEDAHGVRVVLTAVPGLVVDGRGPGAGVPGVGGEVADGVAELMADRPPERAGGVAAGPAGDRRGPGERGWRPGAGEPGPAVADLGSCRAARRVPVRGRLDAVAVLTGSLLPAPRTPGRESSRT